MPVHVNVNGSWKNTKAVSVKVNGSWKDTYQVYVNANGTWKPMWKYSWETGSWGSCSASCGGGTQTRTATCKRSDGYTVPDSYCTKAGIAKPAVSQSCNTQSCTSYTWQTGSYGLCSSDCGTGTKTRSVYCQRNDGTKVGDSFCSGTKPSTSTSCTPSCYQEYGSWKTVLSHLICGKNQKARDVTTYTNNTYDESYTKLSTAINGDTSDITYKCEECAYSETAWVENKVDHAKTVYGKTYTTDEIRQEMINDFGSVYNHYKRHYLHQSITWTDKNGTTRTLDWTPGVDETSVCPFPGCCKQNGYTYYADENE